jgi:DNA methyltransferase 1-associated protein 1
MLYVSCSHIITRKLILEFLLHWQQVPVPAYTDAEYLQHLHNESWSRQETDHLFDLCRRFDLRFIVIRDRWDRSRFPDRSVEDLKERYYDICATLNKVWESV